VSRSTAEGFLEMAGNFLKNDLALTCLFLAELSLKEDAAKTAFFATLPEVRRLSAKQAFD
jgi:hypothetical protein